MHAEGRNESAIKLQSSPLKRTCGHVHAAGAELHSVTLLHIISPSPSLLDCLLPSSLKSVFVIK